LTVASSLAQAWRPRLSSCRPDRADLEASYRQAERRASRWGRMGEDSPSPYPSRSSPVGLPLGEGKEAPSPGGSPLGSLGDALRRVG
jgi:hypothetical protein